MPNASVCPCKFESRDACDRCGTNLLAESGFQANGQRDEHNRREQTRFDSGFVLVGLPEQPRETPWLAKHIRV